MMLPALPLSTMLQMYSLSNGWNVAALIVSGALLFGLIGLVVGLALAGQTHESAASTQQVVARQHSA